MPELPDVDGFRRVLAGNAVGRRIEAVRVHDPAMLRQGTPQGLGRALKGRRFAEPRRHGKWLIAPAGDAELLMHFGMTGLLEWRDTGAERHRHDRLVVVCEGGELRYRNMRRFGALGLARDADERAALTGPLGPDAQGLDQDEFTELIDGRRGSVKSALMDQRLIAGLGNLMVDEILWRASVNPRAELRRLSRARRKRIYAAMGEVIRDSVPTGRVPPAEGWLTGVRNARDPHCPRCGRRLRRDTVAGRTTRWCPRCQRR
jgi:formamidopyrimidine-DNA glycosylase